MYMRLLQYCILICCALTLIAGCQSKATPPTDLSNVLIKMKRTACFGTCPVYELTIAGTGKAEYCGAAFVNVRGRKSFTISEAEVRKLVNSFYEADFWNLSNKYWSPITDQ